MRNRRSTTRGWAVLQPPVEAPYSLFSVGTTDSGELFVGVDVDRRRLLLLPAGRRDTGLPGPFPALALTFQTVVVSGVRSGFLVIRCEDPMYWREFSALAEDVLDSVEASEGTLVPSDAAVRVLDRWRRLLTLTRRDSLGAQQRMGLFAELLVLRRLLLDGAASSTACWKGPAGGRHDFVVGSAAIEVKAVGADAEHVTVHGLEQLETPPDGTLALAVCALAEDPSGQTIGELIADCEELAGGGVQELASSTGWTELDLAQRFVVVEWLFMDVVDDAPRLVPADLASQCLRPGVLSLSYRLAISDIRRRSVVRDVASFTRGLSS